MSKLKLYLFVIKSGLIYSRARNSVVQSIIDLMVNDSVSMNIKFYVVKAVTSEAPLTS